MLFKPDLLPDGVTVALGHVYEDCWISPNLQLRAIPVATPRTLELNFWNPDCFIDMASNSILVRLKDQTSRIENIKLNQFVTISISIHEPLLPDELIDIHVSNYLHFSAHDHRERALKLVRCEWTDV
ncbi:hypothetical protein [uncultured Tateyamaria sp.]|uniref:hypothetical protein n=1 Tax=uncultured Tateyamaria sp. TaxID=455651 RepID=UPI0026215C90|nr:hypothetical protein [uncultured Tateyamaria sp.]